MRSHYASISLLLFFFATAASAKPSEDPLANGVPWQVELFMPNVESDYSPAELKEKPLWAWRHQCGGTLIADGWVLTAAHCIDAQKVSWGYRVRLGTQKLTAQHHGRTYLIDRFVRHAGYDYSNKESPDDIAVVHFVADSHTDGSIPARFAPIRLNGSALNDSIVGAGVDAIVTGWGKDEKGNFHDKLQEGEVTTVDCNRTHMAGRTSPSELCAGKPGVDSCQGDSGGPLIKASGEPVLIGIVSWGIGCARPGYPGAYTRIDKDHYLDWVKRAMAADPTVTELK